MKPTLLKYLILALVFSLSVLLPSGLKAQSPADITLDIKRITVDSQGFLNFWIKSTENGILKRNVNKEDITVTEFVRDLTDTLNVYSVEDQLVEGERTEDMKHTTISFLLDVSDAMQPSSLNQAKSMVREVVETITRAPESEANFFLTAFHEREIHSRRPLTGQTVSGVLDNLEIADDRSPDFYRTLIDEIRHLKSKKGTKALFIFSSGVNVAEGSAYDYLLPYELQDVREMVQSLQGDGNFRLFVIRFQPKEDQSENLTLTSLNSEYTQFSNGRLPDDYLTLLMNNRPVESNILLKASFQNDRQFRGENCLYEVELKGAEQAAEKLFRLGSINFPVSLRGEIDWITWASWLVVGMIIVLIIYGIGSVLIPFFREREFARKYVSPYVKGEPKAGAGKLITQLQAYDTHYNERIEEGELVVRKCRQITPFSTWKELGWQCPEYPVCINSQNCNGAGGPDANNFSSMEGIYLKLNWIWFGAMGGLIAWIIISLFRMLDFQGVDQLISLALGRDFLDQISQGNPELVIQTIRDNLLVGVAFGAGLLLMLSWMEERRASNRYSNFRSALRVTFRTLAGIVLSMIIFYAGFYLQYVVGIAPYASGLISWLFFGLGVGLILSVYSSISWLNGIIGSILGAVIAFQVYWILVEYLNTGFVFANLASMILMGAIIGSTLVSVVSTLEDYELEVIAPVGFQRTIPISKWLKSNIGVHIGKSPGSYIYIKWDDEEVRPEHAELFSEDGQVFVRPIAEVLVNNRMISKPVLLKNGDIIRLSRAGLTQLKFVEK